MNNSKILFIDDDQRICRLVKRYLESNDFKMIAAHNAEDALNVLQDESIALILLDIMLPDKDGLTLAQEIRNKSNTPIIFLTAKAEIDDKVTGLEIGADDYITKPFEEKELVARIQTVLRRTQPSNTKKSNKTEAGFAGWRLNFLTHTLYSPKGVQVDITLNIGQPGGQHDKTGRNLKYTIWSRVVTTGSIGRHGNIETTQKNREKSTQTRDNQDH